MKKTLLSLLLIIPAILHAQYWNGDAALNNVVVGTSASGTRTSPVSAKDKHNNVFVAWVDSRNSASTGNDIYIQKINKDGSMAWATNGIPVCTASGAQSAPSIASDGDNGVILVWLDGRSGTNQVYAQRIDSNGVAKYASNGFQVAPTSTAQLSPIVTALNQNDAMVFFRENRGTNIDLYLQKIVLNTGTSAFTGEVAIAVASGVQNNISMIADGEGGAYLSWEDPRGANTDVYAQRISNTGNIQWTANGINVTPSIDANQLRPAMALDSVNGGFFMAWQDLRLSPSDGNIYAQKVNADGTFAWTNGGIPICQAANSQDPPKIVNDGNEGAIIAWIDPRDGLNSRKLFAQRVNKLGAVQWTADGVNLASSQLLSISTSTFTLTKGKVAGTAIIVWQDTRNSATTNNDIYAQKLNSDGSRAWADAGLIVCNANGAQANPVAETDGDDNIIVAWTDGRSGTANAELYTSNILSTGVLPVTYTGIQAKRSLSAVVVTWDIASEINTIKYLVERSADGKNFAAIGNLQASKKTTYNFTDANPLQGVNYYRVVGIDADGTLSPSDVAKVTFSLTGNEVQVYPNPVTAELKIKLNRIITDKLYNFTLTDITGKIQFNASISGKNLQGIYPINVSSLNKGMYFLTIKQGNETVSYPVVKN